MSWIIYRSNFIFELLLSHILLNLVDIHEWCWMRSDVKIDVRQLTYVNIFWMWKTVTYSTWSTTMLSGAQFSQHLSHWHVEHRDWTEQSCSSSIAYRLWLFHLIHKKLLWLSSTGDEFRCHSICITLTEEAQRRRNALQCAHDRMRFCIIWMFLHKITLFIILHETVVFIAGCQRVSICGIIDSLYCEHREEKKWYKKWPKMRRKKIIEENASKMLWETMNKF